MRYYFHIFDGSVLHPDYIGNALPDVDCAKRLAATVADELKKGGELARSNLVLVADENDDVVFACGASDRLCGSSGND